MDSGHDFKSIELAIRDVFDDLPDTEQREGELLKQLLARIKDIRQSDRVSMAEILFVRLGQNAPALFVPAKNTRFHPRRKLSAGRSSVGPPSDAFDENVAKNDLRGIMLLRRNKPSRHVIT